MRTALAASEKKLEESALAAQAKATEAPAALGCGDVPRTSVKQRGLRLKYYRDRPEINTATLLYWPFSWATETNYSE